MKLAMVDSLKNFMGLKKDLETKSVRWKRSKRSMKMMELKISNGIKTKIHEFVVF